MRISQKKLVALLSPHLSRLGIVNILKEIKKAKKAKVVIYLDEVRQSGWRTELIPYYLGSGAVFDADFVERVEDYLTKEGIEWRVKNSG